jgi:hypothetical protein
MLSTIIQADAGLRSGMLRVAGCAFRGSRCGVRGTSYKLKYEFRYESSYQNILHIGPRNALLATRNTG